MTMLTMMVAIAAFGASDPDGVISTAPVGHDAPLTASSDAVAQLDSTQIQARPHGLTTQQQIDRWMAASAAPASESDAAPHLAEEPAERRVRGEVSVAVGSGDYRAWSATVEAPLGEDGHIAFSYGESRGGRGYYPAYGGYPIGYGAYDRGYRGSIRAPASTDALGGPRRDPETGILMAPNLPLLDR